MRPQFLGAWVFDDTEPSPDAEWLDGDDGPESLLVHVRPDGTATIEATDG